jgi:hypothetical protein
MRPMRCGRIDPGVLSSVVPSVKYFTCKPEERDKRVTERTWSRCEAAIGDAVTFNSLYILAIYLRHNNDKNLILIGLIPSR